MTVQKERNVFPELQQRFMSKEKTECECPYWGKGGVYEDDADLGADGIKCPMLGFKH